MCHVLQHRLGHKMRLLEMPAERAQTAKLFDELGFSKICDAPLEHTSYGLQKTVYTPPAESWNCQSSSHLIPDSATLCFSYS